jgi:hypothetical protein
VIAAHGEGAVKGEVARSIDSQTRGNPDGINRGAACVAVVGSRRGSWRVLSKDGILETQRRKLSSKPAYSNISIIVNAQHNVITCFQGGGDS